MPWQLLCWGLVAYVEPQGHRMSSRQHVRLCCRLNQSFQCLTPEHCQVLTSMLVEVPPELLLCLHINYTIMRQAQIYGSASHAYINCKISSYIDEAIQVINIYFCRQTSFVTDRNHHPVLFLTAEISLITIMLGDGYVITLICHYDK